MAPRRGPRLARRKPGSRLPAGRIPLPLNASSSIAAAEYDIRRRLLRVRFSSGGIYDYVNVPPDVVMEFLNAPSLGRFVNWRIKPYYRAVRVN